MSTLRQFINHAARRAEILCVLVIALFLTHCSDQSPKVLRIGDQAPSFFAQDMEGNSISSSALSGRSVILRFWSTDCKYCRADTPIFNDFFQKYKEQGLVVLYINTAQTDAEVRAFIKEFSIGFPVIRDTGGEIAKSFHIKAQPITIMLSPEQTILAARLGGVSEAELADLLKGYLSAPAKAGTSSGQSR